VTEVTVDSMADYPVGLVGLSLRPGLEQRPAILDYTTSSIWMEQQHCCQSPEQVQYYGTYIIFVMS